MQSSPRGGSRGMGAAVAVREQGRGAGQGTGPLEEGDPMGIPTDAPFGRGISTQICVDTPGCPHSVCYVCIYSPPPPKNALVMARDQIVPPPSFRHFLWFNKSPGVRAPRSPNTQISGYMWPPLPTFSLSSETACQSRPNPSALAAGPSGSRPEVAVNPKLPAPFPWRTDAPRPGGGAVPRGGQGAGLHAAAKSGRSTASAAAIRKGEGGGS